MQIIARLFPIVLVHMLISVMVVLGIYQVVIASIYFAECPANDFVPQYLIILGCLCILDMVFSVLAIIPTEIAVTFFYVLMVIRFTNLGLIFVGFNLYKSITLEEMTHFCVPILVNTLGVAIIFFATMLLIYYVLLIFNIITAVALMKIRK